VCLLWRLAERADVAAVAVIAAMAALLGLLKQIGSPTPMVPEALWVHDHRAGIRLAAAVLAGAVGLSIVSSLLRRRAIIGRVVLVVAWIAFAALLVRWHGPAIAAITRVVWDRYAA